MVPLDGVLQKNVPFIKLSLELQHLLSVIMSTPTKWDTLQYVRLKETADPGALTYCMTNFKRAEMGFSVLKIG